ncbi:hypothetical protein BGY98DRAFT_1183192 [Russula aff. rugulosa BPL654]|nr:hypothetical protein BGY98DRAFT_1183192 [Russula aff. rugulosa BPL654]
MAWNIDYEYDSEEVILLKKHIAEQDNRYSTLQSQLIKANNALDDNKATLDETTSKLHMEADRAHRLDEELRGCKEILDREKVMRQNADVTVRSAAEREKQEEITRRELQQALESISSRDTASNAIISNLRNEKVITAATPKRKGRARSSSLSDVRITALERDLGDSQASMMELRAELGKAQEKLRRTEEDLCRVENDKAVLERRTSDDIRSMQGIIASKDEEIMRLSGGVDAGLAQEREEELIRRVEEEEAKVLAMERLLSETRDLKAMESALQKAEKRLTAEMSKVKGLEEKNVGLNRDVKRARHELEDTRSQAQALKTALDESTSLVHSLQAQERALTAQVNSQQEKIRSLRDTESCVPPSSAPSANGDVDAATDVQTIEKLLAAVNRLRGERDDLRRQLEFLHMESKFTIDALESKINSGATSTKAVATAGDPRVSQLQGEVQELLERLAQANSRMQLPSSAMDSSRLNLVASASLVMVKHLQNQIDHDVRSNDQAHGEMLTWGATSTISDSSSQVAANTRSREQWQELQSDLAGKTARVSDITRSLEDAETERNSLKVEVVNLQNDMASAQEELKQAEQRYSNLQNQQLSSMSTTQVNRKLKEQIEELEGRVARRTEQIGIHQHDIKRLETNLRLQEDRIAEMTTELEVAMSEKESMVEDCADAREARDRTLKKVEDLEEAMETLETQLQSLGEQREVESRSSTSHLRAITSQMGAAKDTRGELNDRFEEINSLQDQLRMLRSQGDEWTAEQQSDRSVEFTKLQQANTDLDRLRADLEGQLSRSREELCLAIEQRDQLRTDGDALPSTSRKLGKLMRRGEGRSDLSTVNIELESRLENISQQQETDTELMTELQSREVGHTEQLLDLQTRLDKCTEELQQTLREKSEVEILLQQTKTELSRANDDMEDRVSRLLEERDESLDEVGSRHAKEMDRVQGHLRDLETEADSLRAQLDKLSSRAELDDLKAQLSALEAEFDGVEAQNALEKGALEEKNTNLSRNSTARESTAIKTELEQVKEKYAHAERDGKAAEMQLTFQSAQHDQAVASLEREIQLLRATSRPDERVQELEEKISYMDELMRSKTQEIEENDDRFIELHKEKKKLTAKVETLNRKDAMANQNPPQQPTASTSKQKSPVTQQPLVAAPARYTRSSPPTLADPSTPPSRSRAMSGPSTLLGRKTPENEHASSSVFRARTLEPAKAPAFRPQQDPAPIVTVAGKKRAAPDDGDEPAPVQGFTSDGVLVTERGATTTTPRRRKVPVQDSLPFETPQLAP